MPRSTAALILSAFLLIPACDDSGSESSSSGQDGGDDGTGGDTEGGACWSDDDPDNDTTDGSTDDTMKTWGTPCKVDADCVPALGDGAICALDAVIYGLPGGFCTRPCNLPDTMTTFVTDDPACDPDGGVDCVGAMGIFERCIPPCTDDAQCSRDGYFCKQMPQIAGPGDPSYCLMPECCEGACGFDM